MRADIKQQGRDFEVTLFEGTFLVQPYFGATETLDRFRGQDNPDGVLFFSRGGNSFDTLFWEEKAGEWTEGQARGPFQDGRILAVFNGTGNGCTASDHRWTFERR